jgi:hypothetical protein
VVRADGRAPGRIRPDRGRTSRTARPHSAEQAGWKSQTSSGTSSSATPRPTEPGPSGSPGSWKPSGIPRCCKSGISGPARTSWSGCAMRFRAPAGRTIAVLSAGYLASQYGTDEWTAAFLHDADGRQRLLPVRVEACQLPRLPCRRGLHRPRGSRQGHRQATAAGGCEAGPPQAGTTAELSRWSWLAGQRESSAALSRPPTSSRPGRRSAPPPSP